MPFPIGAALGAGASVLGSVLAGNQADKDRALMQQQIDRLAGVQFNPFSVMGPGGAGVSFNGSQANLNLGSFEPFQQALQQLGLSNLGSAQALQGAAGSTIPGTLQAANFSNQLAGTFGGATQNLATTGFQRALQQQLFGQAGQFANDVGSFDQVRGDTLNLLRAQAQPFEERAFSNLQDAQFAQGRLGSTGGALQTEAFARGLAQADIGRQVEALNQARATQSQNANLAQLFSGLGTNLAGTESDLLNASLGRFGTAATSAAGLSDQVFNRGSGLFNQFAQGLGAQQSILDSVLGLGQFGANLGAQRANTDIAAAGGAANAVGALGPSGQDLGAAFLSTLGGNLLQSNGGVAGLFSGLFNRTPAATTNSGINTSSLGGVSGASFNPFAGMFGGGGP